jgi:hypothetical protein
MKYMHAFSFQSENFNLTDQFGIKDISEVTSVILPKQPEVDQVMHMIDRLRSSSTPQIGIH